MNTLAFIQNISGPEILILNLIWLIIGVIPFWQIFKRIGWPPALALLAVIPGAIFVMLYVVAFASWKQPNTN
ncbi:MULTISPECIES: hypothetical protein [unclassified Lentimonas]|uniref:hypothetical protein n=1 Tax=unclassified Lentimonas TaxID=2630993 RepID=UPI00132455E4|nr:MULTISPECIES: hypothetical protein [unclassified Lentimonas]CAA6679416.1 Unannotated [Lentimonas sp. CC4]CAA6687086.1 Unannotated [Lentimonas sp. CC6]CAA7075566.1 Unannotated [Lentimonas sp. CC4]CAA7170333.1 Unannotated [Lentimonas sp. CC21]CAA7182627.1 Unannotated [Lentimonas sp. CC8]